MCFGGPLPPWAAFSRNTSGATLQHTRSEVWSPQKKRCKIKQNQEQWLSASQPSSSIICKLSLDVWTSHTGTRKGELKKVVKFMSRCKGLVQLFNHQRIEDQKWDFSFLNSHEIFFVQPFVRSFFRGFILHTRLAYFLGSSVLSCTKNSFGTPILSTSNYRDTIGAIPQLQWPSPQRLAFQLVLRRRPTPNVYKGYKRPLGCISISFLSKVSP